MMSALSEQSELYKQLNEMYANKESKDISESFFNECISVASRFSKREIQFLLFKLKLLGENLGSGGDEVDTFIGSLQRLLDFFLGRNIKRAFLVNVLEIALAEKVA